MNKKLKVQMKGQITVFASLVIVLVLSVVCASIKSASMSVAKMNVNAACNLSVESIFAEYSKPLLKEYDVLFFKKTDELENKLRSAIKKNTEYSTGFTSENLQSLKINELVMATDKGGTVIKQQILDYMDYGIYSEVAQMIIQSEEQVKKSEKTKEIVEKISECEKQTSQIKSIVLQLVTKVEGLDTDGYTFKAKNNRPIEVEDNFVKMFCTNSINNKNVAVNDTRVYAVLSKSYINAMDLLIDMNINAESIIQDGENDGDYDGDYESDYDYFNALLISVIEKSQEAITIAESYESAIQDVTNAVVNVENDVEINKSVLGDELTNSFEQDLMDLKDSDKTQSQSICDVNKILSTLKSNLSILKNTKQIFNSINNQLNKENAEQVMSTLSECVDVISGFDNSNLNFDYSGVEFSANSAGTGAIDKILSLISEGTLGLVITDTSKISQKSIDYNDLASSQQSGSSNYWSNITEEAKDNILYNEYLFSKFSSYTDSFDSDGNVIQKDDLLDYSLEYILYEKNTDKENLESTILRLTLIRQGANLGYLFTDSEKKNESFALALSLLGFTGNYALIKAGQYLIMSAWASGEAVMDVRNLCNGGKVKLIKNSSDWQLSLVNLLAMDFASKDSNTEEGLDYEQYLRMLLYLEAPVNKYFRTMNVMEMKMIEKGYEDFRLKNYIYYLNATAVFSINGSAKYIQEIQYDY